MWKPDDFQRFSLKDLMRAVNGYRNGVKEQWEMVRVQAAYSIAPHHDSKKGSLKFEDITLPIDKPKKYKGKVGKRIKLTKEQVKEEYTKAGIIISDDALAKLFEVKN